MHSRIPAFSRRVSNNSSSLTSFAHSFRHSSRPESTPCLPEYTSNHLFIFSGHHPVFYPPSKKLLSIRCLLQRAIIRRLPRPIGRRSFIACRGHHSETHTPSTGRDPSIHSCIRLQTVSIITSSFSLSYPPLLHPAHAYRVTKKNNYVDTSSLMYRIIFKYVYKRSQVRARR